ncbi:MAG TPA: hypothetical protein VMU43_02245 [Candidatus Acidoferrum sp.]|nr:hypothetical protein [Candidatus Acidoferrum sp.]
MQDLKTRKEFLKIHFISPVLALGLVFGAMAAPKLAVAGQTDSSTQVPVRMVVTVKAKHGAQVPAVAKDDVAVYQRGKVHEVTSWVPLQGNRAGLQLYILIDDTARHTLSLQYSNLRDFIEEQAPTTAIGVGYMRNGMVVVAQNPTTDHALAAKALRLPIGASVGVTSPYLALSDLMKKWPVSGDRREVLMITSGIDALGGGFFGSPYNNPYFEAALNQAQRGGFIVYSIYTPSSGLADRGLFRTNLDQTGLYLLGEQTGGQAYYLLYGSPVDITPYLQDVNANLKHQYELTYLAKAGKKAALEPVKVKTEVPDTGLVTAANGYVEKGM